MRRKCSKRDGGESDECSELCHDLHIKLVRLN